MLIMSVDPEIVSERTFTDKHPGYTRKIYFVVLVIGLGLVSH
jgi:hypothetical protein